MTFAIITNFNIPCLAHTKTIVIIRNQILLLLCHLKDCSSGYKSGVWFYPSCKEVLRTYYNSQEKKTERRRTTLHIFAESTVQWAYTFSIYTTAFKCGALKIFIHVYLYLRILRIFPVKIHLLLSLNSEEAQNPQVIHKV